MPDVHTDSARDRERRYRPTQPQCALCWQRDNPQKEVATVINREYVGRIERCSSCGQMTTAGIYVEVDVKAVPYPSLLLEPDPRGLWAEPY